MFSPPWATPLFSPLQCQMQNLEAEPKCLSVANSWHMGHPSRSSYWWWQVIKAQERKVLLPTSVLPPGFREDLPTMVSVFSVSMGCA